MKLSVLDRHIEFKRISVKFEPKLQDIRRYLEMFLNSTKKPLSKFNEEDLVNFINSISTKFSIRTCNDIKCYLKVFIKWHYKDYSSRFRNLDRLCRQQKPSSTYQPEQMLKVEDVEKIIQAENNFMWRVYWLVFFYGGFRPSECARLKWEQVYFEPEGVIIKVHTTKTNKDFYKSLPPEAEHLLKELKQNSNSEYLFPSRYNNIDTIQPRSICGRLKRLSKSVLGYEVVPYQLRHSIATILYDDDNRKEDDTANQLGHTKSMKQTYTHLNEERKKARARKLWTQPKPLTKDERDKIKLLEQELTEHKEQLDILFKMLQMKDRKEIAQIVKDYKEGKILAF